jgi:hypothetical protein
LNIDKISPRAAHRVALLFCPVFEIQPNEKGNAMPEDGDDSDERDEERFVRTDIAARIQHAQKRVNAPLCESS